MVAASFSPRRRRLLITGAAAVTLSGCALHPLESERIIDVASGQLLTRAQLLVRLREADWVLLGEQHDNPHHHERRGALIAELGAGAVVVSEHLERGRRVESGPDTQARLQAAGFDLHGWQWPIHRALYEPLLAAGIPVLGGDLARGVVREVARRGLEAAPAELRALVEAAPLTPAAQAALDQALVDSHCGRPPPARLPSMRAAQRVRDAALALALQAAGGRPGVLVAGNGHVRLDYGVPVMLRQLQPRARLVSVGFGEPGWDPRSAPYTLLWLTAGVKRADPCAGMPPLPG